jgi:hypothetical protein
VRYLDEQDLREWAKSPVGRYYYQQREKEVEQDYQQFRNIDSNNLASFAKLQGILLGREIELANLKELIEERENEQD